MVDFYYLPGHIHHPFVFKCTEQDLSTTIPHCIFYWVPKEISLTIRRKT